jgi:putative effector of murein hydrolase LrgA (UPF0299 family)
MSTFKERMAIIPRAAKTTAVLLTLGMVALIIVLSHIEPSHGEAPLPTVAKVILPIVAGAVTLLLVLLIGFVYGDAKQRGMRYVMWTLLAVFLPDAIGIILYFILRDPMPVTCPHCSTKVISKFAFCPSCGTSLKPTCPQCGQAVEPIWSNCGHCGTKLPGPIPRTV